MSTLPNKDIKTNLPTLPNLIQNVVNQFIVRPLGSPQVGVSGYVFDLVGSEEISLDADITDHYVEGNYAIQDHIALKAERFVLSGFVGELQDIFPHAFLSVLTNVQSLGTIFGLAPEFSAQATKVYGDIASVASKAGEVLNQAKNIRDIFTQKSTTATRQQDAFKYFYDIWESRQLCRVETPYGIFDNMAVESVRAKQDETTRLVSDFVVSFKKIRTTETKKFRAPKPILSGRAISAAASEINNQGPTAGKKTTFAIDELLENEDPIATKFFRWMRQ